MSMRTTKSSKFAESDDKKAPATIPVEKKVSTKGHRRRTPTRFGLMAQVLALVMLSIMVGGYAMVAYEGRQRMQQAEEAIESMQKHIVTLTDLSKDQIRIKNLRQHGKEDTDIDNQSNGVQSLPKEAIVKTATDTDVIMAAIGEQLQQDINKSGNIDAPKAAIDPAVVGQTEQLQQDINTSGNIDAPTVVIDPAVVGQTEQLQPDLSTSGNTNVPTATIDTAIVTQTDPLQPGINTTLFGDKHQRIVFLAGPHKTGSSTMVRR